ncbi:type VI secretion system Vgr family protein [Chromobacterium violaceum]|uniref:type VI secretion system Vgr family protein n=2 Tax=Chromobacterium violaceum TaxID=536 RepID=UPI0009DA33F5|nr:type VI secretion system Vgr family protein [Chromobacterium violaceum]OQS45473.1 type VI secretion system protein [Chromobacterium violaceum]OQS47126.1 type VI secretion system protein [Chromobacterium violaceum]QRO32523.1 type VI secretion system tip protein VgrG [Chromobacterium violaceum]QRQ17676.1 type VI secretion system tip protein VgrG [Chromobacterium violaceum]
MDLNALLASFASAFGQDRRVLTLRLGTGQIAAEQLLPLSLQAEEGLSQPYRYTLTCLSPDTHIELKSLLGEPARIGIEDASGGESIRCGVVSQARLAGTDGGFAKYALTIEPPFALLRHRKTSRVFQDLSVPDIVKQILSEHQAANPAFARTQTLDIQVKPAPPRSYTLQYRESDFDFIVRLLHEEGYAWRFLHQDDDGPQVQLAVFDDPHSLPAAPLSRVRFHRADATEDEDGLTEWQAARQIVPSSVALASYDYKPVYAQHSEDGSRIEQGQAGQSLQSSLTHYDAPGLYYAGDEEQLGRYAQLRQQANDLQAKSFSGSGSVRGLQPGEWFRLDDHPAHDGDAAENREFVVTGQSFQVRNNLPQDLVQHIGTEPDATPFVTSIQAQRRSIPLTPAYAGTPLAKPKSRGVQTATVVGPAEPSDQVADEIYTDAQGRIKVQFHWQRPQEHPQFGANLDDKSSCWLRVAMPSAGAGWGHQFIPRIGQEVLVDFIEGDIDRPLVTGVFYNGSHPTPDFSGAGSLPANKTLSGIKSKEHQGGGYNELLFDDTSGEVRAKLSSEPGKTQLNQGFLTHPRSNGKAPPRGEGFELRTDHHGAIRAAHGLLLSTEAQNGAGGKQLAREHAQSQLQSAVALSQALTETATEQLADTMETGLDEIGDDNVKSGKKDTGHLQHQLDALAAWEAGSNTDKDAKTAKEQEGQQPLLILSGPAGIASVTEQSQTVSAGTNLNLVAQRDANHTTGRRWIHNVGKSISLFVAGVKDKIGMKLIAAKGKVQIQAQSDAMELTADKDVTITSCKQRIEINAKKEILFTAGGAYFRIAGGNIEVHAPGTVSVKGASHDLSGPDSLGKPLPVLPGDFCLPCLLEAAKKASFIVPPGA